MDKIEYEPRSVRELLTEMKDVSDLMVDLAYAVLLFRDKELAKQVKGLESKMDELMYRIRIIATVAARSVGEAEKITGILQVAGAAEDISNATADIADLVLRNIDVHPVVHEAILEADEKLARVEVPRDSMLAHQRLKELKLPSSLGVWLIALRRDGSWFIPPSGEVELKPGDLVVARGPEDGIESLMKIVGIFPSPPKRKRALCEIRGTLAGMRDLSSVMVDMAYSSLLFTSKEIAQWVRELEEKFDRLNYKLWLAALRAAKRERDLTRLNSVLQVVKCMEKISDAADSIADVVLRGVELHPIFSSAIAQADERISGVKVSERSPLVNRTLGELNLWTTMGVYVLMIKRGERYLFNPGLKARIKAGDFLIARGSELGMEKLQKVAAGEG